MGTDGGYAESQDPGPGYAGKQGKTAPAPAPPASLPEVTFVWHVLASVTTQKVEDFIRNRMAWAMTLWRPKDDDLKRFEVGLKWDGTYRVIPDPDKHYRRIDLLRDTSAPLAVQLVRANFVNPDFAARIPVFVCEAAWSEQEEPGTPRDGETRGYTLVKSIPGYGGERAILLFASRARPQTLAHELAHWLGFSHGLYAETPSNIAHIGGGGVEVDREELRRLHRWATSVDYRKQLTKP